MSNYNIEEAWREDKAMYWELAGTDRYGQATVLAPVEIDVRWEEIFEESLDAHGKNIILTAMVVVAQVIPIGSIMWRGSSVEYNVQTIPVGYKQVKYRGRIPGIQSKYVRKTVSLVNYSDTLPTIVAESNPVPYGPDVRE